MCQGKTEEWLSPFLKRNGLSGGCQDNTPVLLQDKVTVRSTVLVHTPKRYCFAVIFPMALFAERVALDDVAFQAVVVLEKEGDALIQVAEEPL